MKHILIILSILLLSSFLISCEKKNGQGTMTWSDGKKYVGEWKDGKPWNLISYYKDGNIELKIVNGEIQ